MTPLAQYNDEEKNDALRERAADLVAENVLELFRPGKTELTFDVLYDGKVYLAVRDASFGRPYGIEHFELKTDAEILEGMAAAAE